MQGQLELSGNVTLQPFNLKITSIDSAVNNPVVTINYVATGPEQTNSLSSWEYSLDQGTNWFLMNLGDSPVLDVEFSQQGSANQLQWNAYKDLKSDFFNNDIYVRLKATDGTFTTPFSLSMFFVEKNLKRNLRDPIKSVSFIGVPGDKILPELFN
jgi:hypothetical protein